MGVIQLLQLSSPKLHFIFAVFPLAHILHLISEEGRWAQYRGPRRGGTKPFLLFPVAESRFIHSPSGSTGRGAYLVCKSGRGEGLAEPGAQPCISGELFPGLCLPGCVLWVTMCVMVRLLWASLRFSKNRNAKHWCIVKTIPQTKLEALSIGAD